MLDSGEAIHSLVDWPRVAGVDGTESPDGRLKALCHHLRTRVGPRHQIDLCDREDGVARLRQMYPDAEGEFTQSAEEVLQPEFQVSALGGRHYWLSSLRQAYWLTGSDRYVAGGIELLQEWTRTAAMYCDPFLRKIQFEGLTNANATVNLLDFFAATRDSTAWTDERMEWFLGFLRETVSICAEHQKLYWHNMHAIVQGARQQFAVYLPEFAASAETLADSEVEMELCCEHSMRPDGSNMEQSPNYHRAVLEGIIWFALERELNGLPVSKRVKGTIDGMARFLLGIQTPDGDFPMFSDSGYGYVTPELVFQASLCHPSLRYRGGRPSADQCLSLPAAETGECLSRAETDPTPKDTVFPDAGYYFMRSSWEPDATYLAFDAGPCGYYHGHLDLLSICLHAGDRTLLTDPGYPHTAAHQVALRSTPFHNTISLDGYSHGPYESEHEPLAHVTQWETQDDGAVMLSAWHSAYEHLWGAPVVRRQIFFDGHGLFVIVDRLDCAQPRNSRRPLAFVSNFNLSDPVLAEIDQPGAWCRTTFPEGPNLFLRSLNPEVLHMVYAEDGVWLARPGDHTVRRARFCANTDRAFMAFALRVSQGEAQEVRGEAKGDSRGRVRVAIDDDSAPLVLNFELSVIEREETTTK